MGKEKNEIIKWLQETCLNKKVYAIPKNGLIIGLMAGLNLVDTPEEAEIIFDDIIDSGRTIKPYIKEKEVVSIYLKRAYRRDEVKKLTSYRVVDKNTWVKFDWEKDKDDEDIITRMLERIGENPNREGLIDTPKRVVKMWKEIYRGYDESQKPKITIFNNDTDGVSYDQMICDSGDFYSHCEHHMVPFFGKYYFAYIPDKKILGISKVARLIDYHCAKLQIQERLVKDILDDIEKEVKPLGIALVMKGTHLCKVMRGVKKKGLMITSDLRGVFKEDPSTRREFLEMIKLNKNEE